MFKNIDEAVNYVCSLRKINTNLFTFKKLLNDLNNPQDDFYMIHVAGTDGKGSTVAYLRDLLMRHGFKVGTFTSPHYVKHQDRIRINNENIDDEFFLNTLNNNLDFYKENNLSMFEIDYLLMLEYFKLNKVDIAIVEVGLGGRLDFTNVVNNPKLSIITTIGYDHMDRLGNTLEEICKEKCGIIKKDSKVLIGDLNDNLKDIVKEYAKENHSKYYELEKYEDLGPRRFRYLNNEYELFSYAKYQKHNASLAIKALNIIGEDYPFIINEEYIKQSLSKTIWNARFEIVKQNPCVILDGAHNIHGVNSLVESFDEFSGSKCIIFSALKRKEYSKMLEVLKKHCDKVVITTFPNNEVIDLSDFVDECINENYIEAINEAIDSYDNVLICGSLYFLSEVVLNFKF